VWHSRERRQIDSSNEDRRSISRHKERSRSGRSFRSGRFPMSANGPVEVLAEGPFSCVKTAKTGVFVVLGPGAHPGTQYASCLCDSDS